MSLLAIPQFGLTIPDTGLYPEGLELSQSFLSTPVQQTPEQQPSEEQNQNLYYNNLTNFDEFGNNQISSQDFITGKYYCFNIPCDSNAIYKCQKCQKSTYCSLKCQKKDWKTHRNQCE